MKQSGYAKRLQQKRAESDRDNYVMARQLMVDLLTIVLNHELGLGKERLRRVWDAFSKLHDQYVTIWNSDTRDVEYAKSVIDRELKAICGEYFIPWEERYRI